MICGYIIETPSLSELEEVYSIELESFDNPYPLWYLRILYELSNGKYFLVSRNENGRIDGYLAAIPRKDGLCHIASIAVSPKCRRQYVGSALLQSIFEICSSDNYKVFLVEVYLYDYNAQKFYIMNSFKPVKIIPHYYGRDKHALVMIREEV